MVESRLLHHEMHVTRPVAMPLQHFQQLAHRSVIRNRVRYWHDRLEPKDSLRITVHHSSLVRLLATFVLHIVLSVAVRFPDVDLHSFYWLSFRVLHSADHETRLTFGVVCDLGTIGFGYGIVCVEGSEYGAFGARGGFRVVDAVDQERKAEDIGEEDEFLRRISVDLAMAS